MKLLIFTLISLLFIIPARVEGMTVFWEAQREGYNPGDEFVAEIKIAKEYDEDSCINAVEITTTFPSDVVEMVDFSRGSSILSLWVDFPDEGDISSINEEGAVSFAGGVPGGYCGALPTREEEDHTLARITFEVYDEARESARLDFSEAAAFLHDGQATEIVPDLEGLSLEIIEEKREEAVEEWQKELEADTTLPEPFDVKLSQNPDFFEGKYFIVFSTTDKQTGLDYYEVKEGDGPWRKVDSPYILEDQELTKKIYVKAIDKAGNGRISTLDPRPETRFADFAIRTIKIIMGAVLIIIIYVAWRKIRLKLIEKRKRKNKAE